MVTFGFNRKGLRPQENKIYIYFERIFFLTSFHFENKIKDKSKVDKMEILRNKVKILRIMLTFREWSRTFEFAVDVL